MSRSLTTLQLSQVDRNLLDAIKEKTGMRTNAEVMRSLIRKGYAEVADTKLSKIQGKLMHLKLLESRVIKRVNKGGKLTKLQKLRRLSRANLLARGKYLMSDGTIVNIA